jgi:hypothetical protein
VVYNIVVIHGVDQMNQSFWIRLLPWRQKNKAGSKSAQTKFAPKLRITRENGWVYLELQLVNHSSSTVWIQEAAVVLIDLNADSQTAVSNGQAKYEILQNVGPNDTLCVSLARTIYDAAGRPQGPYSCLVSTIVRYRVFDEWCNAKLETHRVEMAALKVRGLHGASWYDKKFKQSNGSVGLTTKEHKS